MSTADQAWQEYNDGYERASTRANGIPIRLGEIPEAAFMAGYRRALEDAADRIDRGPQIPLPPSIYSALCREWAEDVGTKDGDDEIEVPCLSCNDDPNVDCPVGCGRR